MGTPQPPTPPAPSPPPQQATSQQAVQIDFKQLLGQIGMGDPRALITGIENARKSRLISLVYNEQQPAPTMITPAVIQPLTDLLAKLGRVPRIDLFLRSTGGITEVPWRIVSLLREFADEIGVIVPSICYSASTHIAIGADELVLTPFSTLGSVDPTRTHPLLPRDAQNNPIPTSVQDLKHCIQFIREQFGESYTDQDLAHVMSELFKYINPLAIGALEQSYSLSRMITAKVLGTRKKKLADDHVRKVQDQLAGLYFSHSFPICRSDVETDLGLPVTRPDSALTGLIDSLEKHYTGLFSRAVSVMQPGSQLTFRVGGVIQISEEGWAISQLIAPAQVVADPWTHFKH